MGGVGVRPYLSGSDIEYDVVLSDRAVSSDLWLVLWDLRRERPRLGCRTDILEVGAEENLERRCVLICTAELQKLYVL